MQQDNKLYIIIIIIIIITAYVECYKVHVASCNGVRCAIGPGNLHWKHLWNNIVKGL